MVRSKRKEDFSKFMSSVLRNSMLTGIPQIASAKNTCQRLLRALVFVLCVVGFIYQSAIFMQLYFEYKTVIDIMVVNPKEIDFPGFTFCSPNPVQVDKVCAPDAPFRIRGDCRDSKAQDVDWCGCHPRYCDPKGKLLENKWLPMGEAVDEVNYWDYDQYINYSQSFDDMVKRCYSPNNRVPCNDERNRQHFRVPGGDPTYLANCFSFGTLRGTPNAKPDRIPPRAQFIILLESDSPNYIVQIKHVDFQINFHDPKGFVNPYVSGHSVKPHYETSFWFKKLVKKLLPPPYETNCRDYLAEWKGRGGHGPTDERTCIDECRKNASVQIRGCQEHGITHPLNWDIKRCNYAEFENVTDLAEVCEKDCRPACYEETYTVRKEERSKKSFYCNTKDYMEQVAWISLNFDGMETTIYSYSPKYQIIETFSYLGGYVGMWLGISLVAVFDFFETLVMMCKYPFRRWSLLREKKARIHRMKSAQWTL